MSKLKALPMGLAHFVARWLKRLALAAAAATVVSTVLIAADVILAPDDESAKG